MPFVHPRRLIHTRKRTLGMRPSVQIFSQDSQTSRRLASLRCQAERDRVLLEKTARLGSVSKIVPADSKLNVLGRERKLIDRFFRDGESNPMDHSFGVRGPDKN